MFLKPFKTPEFRVFLGFLEKSFLKPIYRVICREAFVLINALKGG
jgi:hypothetical protein